MSILLRVKTPNPWTALRPGAPPYAHPADLPLIAEHSLQASDAHRIRLDVFPEPYIGDPDAPILLLNLNPGYKEWIRPVHAKPVVAQVLIDNLLHQSGAYPFYPLSLTYLENGGSTWWQKRLRHWINEYGAGVVARCFFCVEYFPYASVRYKPLRSILPSQRYSFDLVATKIRSGCPVIVMRARSKWTDALPGHREDAWCPLNSLQSAYISPGNLPSPAVQAIHTAMQSIRG